MPICPSDVYSSSSSNIADSLPDQRVWSPQECGDIFCKRSGNIPILTRRLITCLWYSIGELKKRFEADKELVWDKVRFAFSPQEVFVMIGLAQDDKDSLDFVVAASNLRAFNYQITMKSRFDVKCKDRLPW